MLRGDVEDSWTRNGSSNFFTNLEATAITGILKEWKADVPSLWHAWKIRAGES
jgi:hypothetical protein